MTWSYRFSFTFTALRLFWNKFTNRKISTEKERENATTTTTTAFNIHKEYVCTLILNVCTLTHTHFVYLLFVAQLQINQLAFGSSIFEKLLLLRLVFILYLPSFFMRILGFSFCAAEYQRFCFTYAAFQCVIFFISHCSPGLVHRFKLWYTQPCI